MTAIYWYNYYDVFDDYCKAISNLNLRIACRKIAIGDRSNGLVVEKFESEMGVCGN